MFLRRSRGVVRGGGACVRRDGPTPAQEATAGAGGGGRRPSVAAAERRRRVGIRRRSTSPPAERGAGERAGHADGQPRVPGDRAMCAGLAVEVRGRVAVAVVGTRRRPGRGGGGDATGTAAERRRLVRQTEETNVPHRTQPVQQVRVHSSASRTKQCSIFLLHAL